MSKTTIILTTTLCVFTMIVSCSGPQKSEQAESALDSLTRIQISLDADITYDNFVGLLEEAKKEVDRLKQSGEDNKCFLSAVGKCYASYEIARKAWKKKQETDDDKKKQDLEMAFAFSKSFAQLNIQKANSCYK